MEPTIIAALPAIGPIEIMAFVGAFLYGTVVVTVVRTVSRDRRNKLEDDVLPIS